MKTEGWGRAPTKAPEGTRNGSGEARASPFSGSSWGAWPGRHLSFRFLASRAGRPHISGVLSPSVCGTLLAAPDRVRW